MSGEGARGAAAPRSDPSSEKAPNENPPNENPPANLSRNALVRLLERVFALGESEKALALLVDLPTEARPDHPRWKDRRDIAREWFEKLAAERLELPFGELILAVYPNVGSNNGDLPSEMLALVAPRDDSDLSRSRAVPLPTAEIFARASVILAPTELSATAPLKVAARAHGFRGATLPDFRREMIPTLALDWEAVDARVAELAARLDVATDVDLDFAVTEGGRETERKLHLDLRWRTAHRSGGLMRTAGTVGNLPSGEAYIVPYEGERAGEPSATEGELPVELDGEVVIYKVVANRAVEVLSSGPVSDRERAALAAEPAYGNLAELGLGILADWGIRPIGSVLLDEKLGLHLAFGRSDHFGGATGPEKWSDPSRVVHLDRVYVPECQPNVRVRLARLRREDGSAEVLMEDGAYRV